MARFALFGKDPSHFGLQDWQQTIWGPYSNGTFDSPLAAQYEIDRIRREYYFPTAQYRIVDLEKFDSQTFIIRRVIPRRPLDPKYPGGYLESDKDYVLNNIEAAVQLLDKEIDDAKKQEPGG